MDMKMKRAIDLSTVGKKAYRRISQVDKSIAKKYVKKVNANEQM